MYVLTFIRGILAGILLAIPLTVNPSTNAPSCSQTHVQAAIDATLNGETAIIAAGNCAWTQGVTISGKSIWLRGATSGITRLTNIGASPLILVTEHTAGSTTISHITFDGTRASGAYSQIRIIGVTGGQPVKIAANQFNGTINGIRAETTHGVIWGNTFDASPYEGQIISSYALQNVADSFPNSWTTYSTMGSSDLTGKNNLYFENNLVIHHHTEAIDVDANSRIVIRYNTFKESGISSHGEDTGPGGTRHWEIANNTFSFTSYGDSDGSKTAPLNYWAYLRGGTGVIQNNVMPDINSTAWGDKAEIIFAAQNLRRNAGPNACWQGGYPAPHQIGQSYPTLDPVYISGNTGLPSGNPILQDYSPDECGGGPAIGGFIQLNRDYKLTARPGYLPYKYPHPLRLNFSPVIQVLEAQ